MVRGLLAAFVVLGVASAAVARTIDISDAVVAESDTGIVFSDLDCKVIGHEVRDVRFSRDVFDYLQAHVQLDVTCVTRDGRRWTYPGGDAMIFPTLEFDWADQAWKAGDRKVAYPRNWRSVDLDPELEADVWTYADDTHVAFKVQLRVRR